MMASASGLYPNFRTGLPFSSVVTCVNSAPSLASRVRVITPVALSIPEPRRYQGLDFPRDFGLDARRNSFFTRAVL